MRASIYIIRELTEAHAAAAFLRLKHKTFCEDLTFWPKSSLGVQVEADDQRARMFALLRGTDLIGGFRVVLRDDQALAPAIRGMRAILPEAEAEISAPTLPAERAFCLASALGPLHKLVDAEVGRLFVRREGACRGLLREVMAAGIGILYLQRVRLFVFTATVERGERTYAMTKPRWRLTTPRTPGLYPGETHAFVAAPEDSQDFSPLALQYAEQLSATGQICLQLEGAA